MSIIVAITGMDGCGKTTLLQNLAAMSAMSKYGGFMTGCMSADMSVPGMQYIFSGSVINREYSLERQFWSDDPARMFTPAAHIDRLYLSGIDNEPETNAATNMPPAETLQVGFFNHLKESDFFDVVYVEAGDPIRNSLSAIAIEQADLCVECVGVSAKGAMWFNNYHSFIANLRVNNNITNGVLLVGIETWHKINIKDTAPFFALSPFKIPFCEEAGIGTEQGVPFVIKQKKMPLIKEEKNYMDKLTQLFEYISNKHPWEQNISIDEYGNPARLYAQQRRTAVSRPRTGGRR